MIHTKFILDDSDIKEAIAHWMSLSADYRKTLVDNDRLKTDSVTLRAEGYGAIGIIVKAEYVE